MDRNDPNDSIWFARAEYLIAGLSGVMDWAHKVHATDYDDIDVFRIATLPGITEIVGQSRLVLRTSSAGRFLDLATMPAELLKPLETYLAETPGFDPDLPIDQQRETPFKMHFFTEMTMRSPAMTCAGSERFR